VFPVRYELGFYIPEDDILHSHRGENLTPYMGRFAVSETLYSIAFRIPDHGPGPESQRFPMLYTIIR
jgi:hypothetical protein